MNNTSKVLAIYADRHHPLLETNFWMGNFSGLEVLENLDIQGIAFARIRR